MRFYSSPLYAQHESLCSFLAVKRHSPDLNTAHRVPAHSSCFFVEPASRASLQPVFSTETLQQHSFLDGDSDLLEHCVNHQHSFHLLHSYSQLFQSNSTKNREAIRKKDIQKQILIINHASYYTMSLQPFANAMYAQLPVTNDSSMKNPKTKEKPVKRSCSVVGCNNGIVQGGVCIAHGAKRRKCRFPGCTKSSKSAGMCSKHG